MEQSYYAIQEGVMFVALGLALLSPYLAAAILCRLFNASFGKVSVFFAIAASILLGGYSAYIFCFGEYGSSIAPLMLVVGLPVFWLPPLVTILIIRRRANKR